MKLTTDGHKATRGLSAIAELLVLLFMHAYGAVQDTVRVSSVGLSGTRPIVMQAIAGASRPEPYI